VSPALSAPRCWPGRSRYGRSFTTRSSYCTCRRSVPCVHVPTGGGRQIEVDRKTTIDVRLQVQNLSFSAHADAKGIMQLIRMCEPRHVILVHGEKAKMCAALRCPPERGRLAPLTAVVSADRAHARNCRRGFLKAKITKEFGIGCYDPANGTTVTLPTRHAIQVDISTKVLAHAMPADGAAADAPNALGKRPRLETVQPRKRLLLDGVLLYGDEKVGPTRQRRHGYGPRRLLTPSGLPAASWWGCRRHRAWWPQTRRRKRSGSGRTRLPSRSGGRFRKRPTGRAWSPPLRPPCLPARRGRPPASTDAACGGTA